MHLPRLSARRIPALLRPLRPPNASLDRPKPRLFTHNSQLLLVSAYPPRPQLPFLHNTSGRPSDLRSSLNLQLTLARFITTERRATVRRFSRQTAMTVGYSSAFIILLFIVSLGLEQQRAEQRSPTPREYSFWTRWYMRVAKAREASDAFGVLNWGHTGSAFLEVLGRLEDPKKDGKGLLEQAEGGIFVPGVGKTGFDLKNKSYQWKSGYYEILMGCAKAAEHLEGTVRDKTRTAMVFSDDVVVGPSNPRPKPVPWTAYGNVPAPLEENCEPAYQSPEMFYMKILTTAGFTSRQRLDAALAYADWLDYKGLPDTAEEMYDWGLDIAVGALPMGANDTVDIKTGVIRASAAGHVSENILTASTALAVHHARRGNLSDALSIFLSVLRARRELPIPQRSRPVSRKMEEATHGEKALDDFISFISKWIREPPYPAPPPSGDEQALRTAGEICEEAGVMTYIGEIIFASSSEEKGLAWTRDAVDAAEAVIGLMEKGDKGADRCRECLKTGFDNWKKMVRVLVQDQREQQAQGKERKKGWAEKWWSKEDQDQLARWEAEEMVLEQRAKTLRPLIGRFTTLDGVEGSLL